MRFGRRRRGQVQDDSAIIEASLESPELFETIFNRHHADLLRYLAGRCSRSDAENLASETFLVAFRRRGAYRAVASEGARPWLYGIATNLLKNQQRREATATAALARHGSELVPEAPRSEKSHSRMISALADLPADQREVIFLHFWADLSLQETAGALGIPLGTAQSRLGRGLQRVREQIEDPPTSSC